MTPGFGGRMGAPVGSWSMLKGIASRGHARVTHGGELVRECMA